MLTSLILQKNGLRNDKFWTIPAIYKSWLKLIPLTLDTRALLKSQYWPRERIDALQDSRLAALIRDAAVLPFWHERLAEAGIDAQRAFSRDTFSRLPIISKKDFVDSDVERYTDPRLYSRSYRDHTSGSTGRPFQYYFDFFAELRSFAVVERTIRTAAGDVRYPVISLRARPRIGFLSRGHFMFFLRGYNSVKYRLDALVSYTKRFNGGFVLYGYTSSLIELAGRIRDAQISLTPKAVIATGEGIRAADRAFIEEILDTEFFTCYATRELGWLGFECSERAMHLNEEWAYFEIVDDRGVALPYGSEGRVTVTTFDNRAMPFIRYDIGDRGSISREACPCGRTLRTIKFAGRDIELIELEDGLSISLLSIAPAFDAYHSSIRQFQIVQKSKGSFTIKVVPGPSFEAMRDAIREHLVRLLHPRAQITWEIADEIPQAPSGKALYFVRDMTNES